MDGAVLLFEKADGTIARRVPLRLGATQIGREPKNDLPLDAPSVSNYHARIVRKADGCVIVDLKSTFGTRVNGEALEADEPRELQAGDRISIGPFNIRFELEPAVKRAPDPAPARVVDPHEAGRRPVPRPNGQKPPGPITPKRQRGERSRLLDFLPPFYDSEPRGKDGLALPRGLADEHGVFNAILLIAEQILDPLDRRVIAQLPLYLQPATTPEAMLPWLACWVGLVLDENWPLARRRELVGRAAELYRWRGTRRGLRDYLQIFAGATPMIVEPGQEPDNPLPAGARRVTPADGERPAGLVAPSAADSRPLAPLCFRVIVPTRETEPAALDRLHQIVAAEKPAHTSYSLFVCPPATT